jgi:hypothetical protein
MYIWLVADKLDERGGESSGDLRNDVGVLGSVGHGICRGRIDRTT